MANVTNAEMQNLYYLGGLPTPQNGVLHVASKGITFTVPPVGEYIQVPSHIAKDVIRRTKMEGKDGRLFRFTTDPRVAAQAKRNLEMGNSPKINLPSNEDLMLKIEALEAELAKTKASSTKKNKTADTSETAEVQE